MTKENLTEKILRFLDGEMTGDEERSLARRIKGDSEAEKTFAQLMRLSGSISTVMAERESEEQISGEIESIKVATSAKKDKQQNVVRRENEEKPPKTGKKRRAPGKRRNGRRSSKGNKVIPIISLIGGIAACLVVGFFVFSMHGKPDIPVEGEKGIHVLSVMGDVEVTRDGETMSQKLKSDDRIFQGDTIQTKENSSIQLSYLSEDTNIAIKSETLLSFERQRNGKLLKLDYGLVEMVVARQEKSHPLTIQTPNAVATVLGTRFSLKYSDKSTLLRVEEGSVQLKRKSDSKTIVVSSGQYGEVNKDNDLVPRTLGKDDFTLKFLNGPRKTTPAMSWHVELDAQITFIKSGKKFSKLGGTSCTVKWEEIGGDGKTNFGPPNKLSTGFFLHSSGMHTIKITVTNGSIEKHAIVKIRALKK